MNQNSSSSRELEQDAEAVNSSCCVNTVENWYQGFLQQRGGRHSEVMTAYFHESNRDVAPLFAGLLNMGIEFRVAGSKSAGLARMQPVKCDECGERTALVILSLPFMLMLFRLQAIFITMIDRWEIIPEGEDRYRERISWHEAGETQVRQLVLGLDMYFGAKDVTLEGIEELVAAIDSGDPHARRILLDALRTAESWVVAHEVFHVFLLAQEGVAFPEFVAIAGTEKPHLDYAAQFCQQVATAFRLQPRIAKSWLEEFQADILACRMLCIAIADRRFRPNESLSISSKDARFHAARSVLDGAAAAFEAIFWTDVQNDHPKTADDVRMSSHPPHHVRWHLISMFMKELIGAEDESLFKTNELMAMLSGSLLNGYNARTKATRR
jgi:hypothetical protein